MMSWDELLAAFEFASILLISGLALYGLGWMLLSIL